MTDTNPTNPPVNPGVATPGVSAQSAEGATGISNPKEGTDDGHYVEIIHEGAKIALPKDKATELAQKGYDYTQKTQQLADKEKAWQDEKKGLLQKINEQQSADPADSGGEGDGDEGKDVATQLTDRMTKIESSLADSELEKKMQPIRQKYPNIPDDMIFARFEKMASAGEVQINTDGLMKAADSISGEFSSTVDKQLENLITSNDPKAVEIKNKIVQDYIEGKVKLINAGGEPGGSAGVVKPDEIKNLDDAVKASKEAHIPSSG